jgi:acetyl-CoA carboxylase biotin carboxylase subunit
MNTRLQVEHPVTEMVTGLDLVRLQIEAAAGRPLPFRQEDVTWRGAAIECRIYAEDPDNRFFPSPGTITRLTRPGGPGVRVDGGVYANWTVPVEYDPLLAKLNVWAESREHAIARALRALGEYDVSGIRTNIGFFRHILDDPEFRAGNLHTGFIDEFFARRSASAAGPDLETVAALAAVLAFAGAQPRAAPPFTASRWRSSGREQLLR